MGTGLHKKKDSQSQGLSPGGPSPRNQLQILLSAFLLILCFPKYNLGWLVWAALVPALSAAQKSKNYREAFCVFFAVGFIFYFVSMEWIRHVTYFGWIVVVAFLAVYYGLFGAAAHFFMTRRYFGRSLLALPALWAVLEWIRTEIPNWSLGWNLLAYSQSHYLPVARFASFLGAYSVSFLIVFVNVVLFLNLSFIKERVTSKEMGRAILTVGSIVLILLGLRHLPVPAQSIFPILQKGEARSMARDESLKSVTLSVIQGNIPHEQTWDPEFRDSIIGRYVELSKLAAIEKPDLIIWPEAAWPEVLNRDPDQDGLLKLVKSLKIPFLIGGLYLDSEIGDSGREKIFNSTYLISEKGAIETRYDKIRLVPFGEFIPWVPVFRILGLEKYAYSFGVGDFTHGREHTIFNLKSEIRNPKSEIKFSTLICYEDMFPDLAREFVKRGAEVLLVVTNDSWYSKSAATYQHMQGSIFRAIENGVPVVRAANVGVSGFISKDGEVLATVKDKAGNDSWIAGGLAMELTLETEPTFYGQFGYWFPWLCVVIILGTLVLLPAGRKNSRRA